jgi:hypothetical protein
VASQNKYICFYDRLLQLCCDRFDSRALGGAEGARGPVHGMHRGGLRACAWNAQEPD